MEIEFSFTEPGRNLRKGSDSVDVDSPLAHAESVTVQYTPGADGRSRLAGHVNWFGIAIFVGSISVVGVSGWRLWREATQTIPSKRTGRRR
jgi:hypothetical protein